MARRPITMTMATQLVNAALRDSGVVTTLVQSRLAGGVTLVTEVRVQSLDHVVAAVRAIRAGTVAKTVQQAGSSNIIDVEW